MTLLAITAPNGAATTPPMRSPTVAVVNASQPRAARKVAELGRIDRPDRAPGIAALDEQVRSYDPTPAATACRVEESTGKPERRNDLRCALRVPVHHSAIE